MKKGTPSGVPFFAFCIPCRLSGGAHQPDRELMIALLDGFLRGFDRNEGSQTAESITCVIAMHRIIRVPAATDSYHMSNMAIFIR